MDAAHEAGDAPLIDATESTDGTTGVRVSHDDGGDPFFLGSQARSQWDVLVPADAELTLVTTLDAATGTIDAGVGPVARVEGTLNAADATIDLGEADTPETATVRLTLNASDGRLVLPVGTVQASVTLNASSLDVCAPAPLPLQVELNETLSSSDLEAAGLEETSAGVWATPDFSSSGAHAILGLASTVSSVSIERPEACS